MTPAAGTPGINDVFVLSEPDYRYGIGPVLARVVKVIGCVEYHGEPWWFVEADVADGTPENHGGWSHRQLYIREATFSRTRHIPTV